MFPQTRLLGADQRIDLPGPALAAAALGVTAVATVGTVWAEKAIVAFGERRRARGVRWAHTPLALVLALGTGALALVDWTRLVRQPLDS